MKSYLRHVMVGLAAGLLAMSSVGASVADQFPVDSPSVWAWTHNQMKPYRAAHGVQSLLFSPRLAMVAQAYAEHQARTNTSGHFADGRDPGQRLAVAGIQYCGVWENVAEWWSSPNPMTWQEAAAKSLEFWKNSPGHRANLQRAEANAMGVGAAGGLHKGRYWYKIVQVFADDCHPPGQPRTKQLGKSP